ncbi:MAG: hypothetical protein Q8Q14_03045, partial [Gemmatimonadales bacterium]|nr:hypothetical protein [Gemmatimonadales bacterium]
MGFYLPVESVATSPLWRKAQVTMGYAEFVRHFPEAAIPVCVGRYPSHDFALVAWCRDEWDAFRGAVLRSRVEQESPWFARLRGGRLMAGNDGRGQPN